MSTRNKCNRKRSGVQRRASKSSNKQRRIRNGKNVQLTLLYGKRHSQNIAKIPKNSQEIWPNNCSISSMEPNALPFWHICRLTDLTTSNTKEIQKWRKSKNIMSMWLSGVTWQPHNKPCKVFTPPSRSHGNIQSHHMNLWCYALLLTSNSFSSGIPRS